LGQEWDNGEQPRTGIGGLNFQPTPQFTQPFPHSRQSDAEMPHRATQLFD
jgi:hypothetical protein